MFRILSIGLDGDIVDLEAEGHAARWTREMARHADEYVELTEAPDGHEQGPVRLAENAIGYRLAGGPALYPFRAARLAERLHRERPFDVVTTEDPIRAGLAGLMFSRRSGVPLNVENHSLQISQADWIAASPHHRLYNRIAIYVARRAATIRNFSPDQIAPLLKIGVPASRLFVIPPPAPPACNLSRNRERARLGIAPDAEIVLSVGRMVPSKNLGTLLVAFSYLRAQRPARLLLAGDGPSRAGWRRHAERLGLGGSVEWLGSVPESEVMALYAAADVFIAPGMHETGPRTVLEAFLAECPVIAMPRMGVTHFGLCAHGESGLIAHPRDPHEMAEAMHLLLDDPCWARRMAREGRARVEEECGVRIIAQRVAEVLRETARRPVASPVPIAAAR